MNIVFYTYGNHQMGMGHIYRSIALIKALEKKCVGVSARLLSRNYKDGIMKIKEFGYPVIQIPLDMSEQTEIEYCIGILKDLHPDVLVTDALKITPAKMALFKKYSKYLVSIDDAGDGRLMANLVVNVLFQTPKNDNRKAELSDLSYLILREEFRAPNRPAMSINPIVKRILVTQGGSDTYGVTIKIARALDKVDDSIEIILLLGPAFKHEKELEAVQRESRRHFIIERDIRDVFSLFSRCDLAITGGGMTLFELAAVGVPSIVLTQEYKEIETIERIYDYGFIKNLGLSENVSDEDIYHSVNELIENYSLRNKMSEVSRKIVDGLGAERIVDIILKELGDDGEGETR
ncbi:PseG/SpsG family protein [Chloroflexota bacterium]